MNTVRECLQAIVRGRFVPDDAHPWADDAFTPAEYRRIALRALDLMDKSGIDVLRSGWTEDEQRKPTYRSIQEPWRDPGTPETEAMKCRICDGSAQCQAVVHIEGCFAGSLS